MGKYGREEGSATKVPRMRCGRESEDGHGCGVMLYRVGGSTVTCGFMPVTGKRGTVFILITARFAVDAVRGSGISTNGNRLKSRDDKSNRNRHGRNREMMYEAREPQNTYIHVCVCARAREREYK